MDLTRPVVYRGFNLNTTTTVPGQGIGTGLSGCVLDAFDPSDVDVVQYMEKRSQGDGMDASQPFLGARRIQMAGTLYALTRGLMYDALWELRAAMHAPLAYLDEPAGKGFQPLYFSVPTNRVTDYPASAIDMRVLAMPKAFEANISRDLVGGEDDDSLALPWQATMVCKDPYFMGEQPQLVDLSGGGTISGDFEHRGNAPSPLNMAIQVGTAAGTILLTAGGTTLTITVPAGANARIFRYKGDEKLLTLEDGTELPRMDLLTLGSTYHPLVPVGTGTNPFSVVFTTVVPQAGSQLWFFERFA
jgi:hypothetical protein